MTPSVDLARPVVLTWMTAGSRSTIPHHHAAVAWLSTVPSPACRIAATIRPSVGIHGWPRA